MASIPLSDKATATLWSLARAANMALPEISANLIILGGKPVVSLLKRASRLLKLEEPDSCITTSDASSALRYARIAANVCHDRLYDMNWRAVPASWRRIYTLASVFVAAASGANGNVESAIKSLDMGLLLGAPVQNLELATAAALLSDGSAVSTNVDEMIPRHREFQIPRGPDLPAAPRESCPSLLRFETEYMMASKPVVLTGAMEGWRAPEKWRSVHAHELHNARNLIVGFSKTLYFPINETSLQGYGIYPTSRGWAYCPCRSWW